MAMRVPNALIWLNLFICHFPFTRPAASASHLPASYLSTPACQCITQALGINLAQLRACSSRSAASSFSLEASILPADLACRGSAAAEGREFRILAAPAVEFLFHAGHRAPALASGESRI